MKFIKDALSHLLISMLLGRAVLVYLDGRNPMMAFLSSGASKTYMLILCAVGLSVAVMYIAGRRGKEWKEYSEEKGDKDI